MSALTIVGASIFDGTDMLRQPGNVRAVDGAIVAVGDVQPQPGDTVLDGAGRTVLPGLIDAHMHAYGTSLDAMEIDGSRLSFIAVAGAQRLRSALRRGFTTVRDVAGGDPGLARAIAQGYTAAPRYLYSGPAISQTGGHGDPRPSEVDHCHLHGHLGEVVDGVDAMRRAVRDRFRTGAHCIKIMVSGGVVSPTDPVRLVQYSADEVRAAVEEATRRESYVAAHAYSPKAIEHAVVQGVRTIEHGNLLDRAAAGLMAQHGAALIPTLVAYDAMGRRGASVGLSATGMDKNREVLDAGKEAVAIARAAGVTIGFGTDLMGALEDDQLLGIRLQADADGMLETLRSATSVNAAILGLPDLGRIGVGAVADLLMVDGDPLAEPSVLWDESSSRTVVQGGEIVYGDPRPNV